MPRALLLGLLLSTACGTAEPEASPTPPTRERSPDEARAEPPPADPISGSGAVVAAGHERAVQMRVRDPAGAVEQLRGSCDQGFAPSCLALADMLERGEGGQADPDAARVVLEQACFAAESTEACDRLGH